MRLDIMSHSLSKSDYIFLSMMGILSVLSLIASLWINSLYAHFVYIFPFFWLACRKFSKPEKMPLASNFSLSIAALGAIVELALVHCLCLYDTYVALPRRGVGANIGLGILLFFMPLVLWCTMTAGINLGEQLQKKR